MSICVHGQDLLRNVLLDACKRLAGGGVVCVEEWFLSVDGLNEVIFVPSHYVVPQVTDQFVFICLKTLLLVTLLSG